MPRKSGPVTDHQRARVLDLHAKGVTRNDIHRLTGVSLGSVSRIVKDAGKSFDRSRVAAATEARTADLAALRTSLALRYVEKAHALLDDMDGKFLAFSFGGKDNTYAEHELDKPPTGDIRNLMQSATLASKESRELVRFDSDPGEGASAVDGWLDHMAGT